MGQNASASRFKIQPTALIPLIGAKEGNGQSEEVGPEPSDCTSDLPDECLALIFESLGPNDRRQCSLVCRRWLRIEGQSHHRLSLNANSGLLPSIPSLFERFDAVTRLTLTCDRRSTSIGDDALVTISVSCSNLRRVKLLACRNLTHRGMEAFAKNCRGLKKFSCSQCPGVVGDSLRTIFLKELYNGPSFYPLIIGSKNLRTLRLMKCSGDWDRMLQAITERVPGMVGIHLERIQVSDLGLNAISSCPSLEIFLMKTPYCTNLGLASVAEHCRLLRKLSIDGCRANSIGDQGLLSVATYCHNLQELVLVGVNATSLSLGSIASNCPNLERLALCGIKTVGDAEIACIAAKCTALKKLCIRSCPITDQGVEAVASGCPCLVKVKIKRCKSVTRRAVGWLRARRESLTLDLDTVGDQELGYLTGGGDW
ncbi:F-box protein At1g47056-like isoform X1 [Punica granatum]|uniref:F-box protein At1g47056-like isoform X1 n=1 Tax=Punica granatum TaxID=22663 RepID=A0A6P8C245_PUNGR|nr:F-box protein At1g47056-like isoform X1 [Punica granatum]